MPLNLENMYHDFKLAVTTNNHENTGTHTSKKKNYKKKKQ